MMRKISLSLLFCALGVVFSQFSVAAEPEGVRPIKAVYFVPADCEPFEGREERLGRVMRHVQEFYRKGMEENGFGAKTFALEWTEPDKLKLYTVNGRKNQLDYGRNDYRAVRNEVRSALREQGINIDDEVIIIFQILLKWDGDKTTEVGPYVGSGSSVSGTAWVYDDAKLDSALLPSNEPGGYYHSPCSLGQFNTHYVGGVAHELGHALSLPHDCETDVERKAKGHSLMGGGNHTYGQNERGQGLGSFLSKASALRLSRVRALAGDAITNANATLSYEELVAVYHADDNTITINGRVAAEPAVVGIIAYNDDQTVNGDYDAITGIGDVEQDGTFSIRITQPQKVPYQLRLHAIHSNGRVGFRSFTYQFAGKETDFSAINMSITLPSLRQAYFSGDKTRSEAIIRSIQRQFESQQGPLAETIVSMAKHVQTLKHVPELIDLRSVDADTTKVDLTFAQWLEAKTAWGQPLRGEVPEDVFLSVAGKFYASGLFAHARSLYRFSLDKKWSSFQTKFGLQDGHDGSVVFVIRGDGQELFRSNRINIGVIGEKTVSVKDVQTLELVVEDAGDGEGSDWGVWIDPVLTR